MPPGTLTAIPFRLNHAVCGTFRGTYQLSCPEKRPQTDPVAGELVDSALLAINDADSGSTLQAGQPKGLDRRHCSPARGDDVLDEAHALA